MKWRTAVAALVLVLGPWPAVTPAGAEAEPDFIAVNPRGTADVTRDGNTFQYTVDLFSLTTLEKIGTFSDEVTCSTSVPPPCLVYDITSTYRVPGGEVVSSGQWSITPDSTRPGLYFAASRPEKETIVSGTGRFAGKTGRIAGWGEVDMREFPNKITVDTREIIRFSPADSHPIGTRELILGTEAPGAERFQTELFSTKGVNESEDPGSYLITNPLYSLSDGSRIGTAIDKFTCGATPPCQVLVGTVDLTYPDGVVTASFEIPFGPDPARSGFYLFGSRPTEDNIVSGTGAYAGRTGRFSVSGSVDMRKFPSPIPYEGVGMVVFNN